MGKETILPDNVYFKTKEKNEAELISREEIKDFILSTYEKSLDPSRKLSSPGWRLVVFKEEDGNLDVELTKNEWLRKNVEYVGVDFLIGGMSDAEIKEKILAYFKEGAPFGRVAIYVHFRYNRLFAKYQKAAANVNEVPNVPDFLERYMPSLYMKVISKIKEDIMESFDVDYCVDKVINHHYIYK